MSKDVTVNIESFFESYSSTIAYIIYETKGGFCALVDSVLDYEPNSGRVSTEFADRMIEFVRKNDLKVQWILETHAHADHISAAPYLKRELGGTIAIGESIKNVQDVFKNIFNLEPEFKLDGSQFGKLFEDGEDFMIGNLPAKAIHVPGHTPADMAYIIGDSIFAGDTIFMPDIGTARCDFPGGSAETMYDSIQKILSYPDDTKIYVCHDYPPDGRTEQWVSTVGEQKKNNIHVGDHVSKEEFIEMRSARDKTLGMPRLIIPSIQMNIRAGEEPPKEDNGVSYLKVPLNKF